MGPWWWVLMSPRVPDLRAELLAGLRAAAAGSFAPSFYRTRVRVKNRWRHWRTVEKRYRRPGLGSRLTSAEARAIQAFHFFNGATVVELARQFHRNRRTIRKALRDPVYQAYVERTH